MGFLRKSDKGFDNGFDAGFDSGFGKSGFKGFTTGADRVTLTKGTPQVSLNEMGTVGGTMQVNLHWTTRAAEAPPRTGRQRWRGLLHPALFRPVEVPQTSGDRPVDVDLDLGCMYELADGTKGVVQPLGNYFGDLQHPPFIRLSRDDRSGSASGEMMYIDLDKRDRFRRLLIFVYIYDETPAFDRTHAVVTLFPPGGRPIEVRLDQHHPQARSCAVALIENRDGALTVRREARYVYGFQAELDRLYGWGLQWQRGYKPAS
ncbi:Tellurium resistance [Streptacidiphilus sp. EB129]|uniref:TerD family protein n=1 Tax=Streptacidiphilus sp. EB129 TaxID=3156262 RepID=UPI00351982B2